jgi:23S rRNA (uracil747-C5)-methyltransferase
VRINPSPGNAILAGEASQFSEGADDRAFRQANPRQAERLYEALCAEAASGSHGVVLDLYSGAGAIAEMLSSLPGCGVVAVDRVPAAPRGVRFVRADVGDFLTQRPPADLVVVNPPRRGLGDSVCRALVAGGYRRLLYVSCMPESLARDMARLADFYQIGDVRPFDLLPQTPHVEILVTLERR